MIRIVEERKMGGNGWGAINNLVNQVFSFLRSKNFIILLAALAIWAGIVKFEEIKDFVETIMNR